MGIAPAEQDGATILRRLSLPTCASNMGPFDEETVMAMSDFTRRRLLAALGLTASAALPAAARVRPAEDGFDYEIQYSEETWREMLSEEEFGVLRRGNTEWPKTTDMWQETRDGTYHCRGCDLQVFTANWKVPLDQGWVFFKHAEPNAVLTAIDGAVEQYGQKDTGDGKISMMEIHCRRCGGHLGHYLPVAGQNVHCINSQSLTFEEA